MDSGAQTWAQAEGSAEMWGRWGLMGWMCRVMGGVLWPAAQVPVAGAAVLLLSMVLRHKEEFLSFV